MTPSPVWFVDRDVKLSDSMIHKLEFLWEQTPLGQNIKEGQNVAIKTHFGAPGNTNYIRPAFIRKLVDLVRARGAKPVVFETCGLGYGEKGPYAGRATAPTYIEKAIRHGFTTETMNAPILMVDGYWGTDVFWQSVEGKHFDKVAIGMALRDFDWVIMFTHLKGHPITGMGGALKNLGIGCVGKYSKARMHTNGEMIIDPVKCLGDACVQPCTRVCPYRCIVIPPKAEGGSGIAEIDKSLCIACGHCQSACKNIDIGAISSPWAPYEEQVERLIDNVTGVLQGIGPERFLYVNLLLDIGEQCDCIPYGPRPLVPDVGILVSQDPLAIDQASYDLVNKEIGIPGSNAAGVPAGEDKFAHALATHDKETGELKLNTTQVYQLQLAKEQQIGSTEYQLIHVEKPRK